MPNRPMSGSSSQYWEIILSGVDLLELKNNMDGMEWNGMKSLFRLEAMHL